MEKEITTHSSILAWGILWTKEPGSLWFTDHKESDTTEQLTVSSTSQNDFLILQYVREKKKDEETETLTNSMPFPYVTNIVNYESLFDTNHPVPSSPK